MNRKKTGIILSAVLAAALLSLAVWTNATAEKIETEHYGRGDWVALDGSFIMQGDYEQTQGYFVQVQDVERMGKAEFEARYGCSLANAQAGDEWVILRIRIKNEDSDSGRLFFMGWGFFDKTLSIPCYVDEEALGCTEPAFREGVQGSLHLRPGTEYTVHIPYRIPAKWTGRIPPENPGVLVLTKYPVRKAIYLERAE